MKVNKRKFSISMLIMTLLGMWIIFSWPTNLSDELEKAYRAIFLLHLFMQVVIVGSISRQESDIFEPITLLLLLYYCIFVYRPIIDIQNDDCTTFGVNPMSACPKSCIIVAVSLLALCYAYYMPRRYHNQCDDIKIQGQRYDRDVTRSGQILANAYVIWTVAFAISVLNLLISGKSLSYIFSLSMSGTISEQADTGIAALSYFAYTMIAPWLYILIYDHGWLKKILLTFLMMCIYIIRGTRILLLCMAAAIILYFYLSRRKRPKMVTMLIVLGLSVFVMSLIQFVRHDIRFGATDSFSWEAFSSVMVTNVFDSDLTIYKQFYAIVAAYPSSYSYTMGRAIIVQTLITMIPRAIWSGKPEVVVLEVIENAVNKQAANSGMAAPNIGEYYFEFGVLGCIVLMFIVGKIFRHWRGYIYSDKLDKIITYSCLYGIIFQLIIRTSTPSIVYQYIFTILPIYLIEKVGFGSMVRKGESIDGTD